MKRKSTFKVLLAAALIAVMTCTAAVAVSQWSVLDLFKDYDSNEANPAVEKMVQKVDSSAEGKTARITMNDAVYDEQGGTVSLSWQWENLSGEENLYVINDSVKLGDVQVFERTTSLFSDFLLPVESSVGYLMAEVPENAGTDCTMSFHVLRAKGEIQNFTASEDGEANRAALEKMWNAGILPLEGDGVITVPMPDEQPNMPYAEYLVSTDLFEPCDHLELSFSLTSESSGDSVRTYAGEEAFIFDGCELHIQKAELNATSASFEVVYITDEKPEEPKTKCGGPDWLLNFADADSGKWFYRASDGSHDEPVQTEDGRWKSVYSWNAVTLTHQPESIAMTLTFINEDNTLTASDIGPIVLPFK